MATIEFPPIEVTLKLTQDEADALYFMLINMPLHFAYRDKLQGVADVLGEYRKQLFGPRP